MKPVKQWLGTIASKKVRGQAMRNLYTASADWEAESLYAALKNAFVWYRAPEGFDYWADIAEGMRGTD